MPSSPDHPANAPIPIVLSEGTCVPLTVLDRVSDQQVKGTLRDASTIVESLSETWADVGFLENGDIAAVIQGQVDGTFLSLI